ncbi:MAG TPA: ABC transporter permease subunit [Rubricoccaceae bacterium]|nr:ABC transporter permease subunit [Rubricoccaceae bacterium]
MTVAVPAAPSAAVPVLRYALRDAVRGRWAPLYALFFGAVTDALFRFSGGGEQVLLSLLNVVLLLVPLVSLVFGVAYLYGARAFVELMLAQPIRRRALFAGLYGGLLAPLALVLVLGVGLPFAWHGGAALAGPLARLLGAGVLLTAAFLALAFLVAVRFEDRMKGLGAALVLWLLLAVVYDGVVLMVAYAFAAYPLERPMIALAMLNPISLARVLLLLDLDVAALLGYTGAAFERFFGTAWGTGLTLGALLGWVAAPLALALRRFHRKDF